MVAECTDETTVIDSKAPLRSFANAPKRWPRVPTHLRYRGASSLCQGGRGRKVAPNHNGSGAFRAFAGIGIVGRGHGGRCGTPGAGSRGQNASGKSPLQGTVTWVQDLSLRWENAPEVGRTFRTRHHHRVSSAALLPGCKKPKTEQLTGIVVTNKTNFPGSRKKGLEPKPQSASPGRQNRKRGLAGEQVPVLVAINRGDTTANVVLPAVNATALRKIIEPTVDRNIVPGSNGHCAWSPCASVMGVRHEALNLSGGERIRDTFQIKTISGRASHPEGFCSTMVASPPSIPTTYLRLFRHVALDRAPPLALLATVTDRLCIKLANWAMKTEAFRNR